LTRHPSAWMSYPTAAQTSHMAAPDQNNF